MAGQADRLLDARKFSADAVQQLDTVPDYGNFTQLNIHIRRLSDAAGQNSTIVLQHAAVNEEGAYRDLASTSLNLETGNPDLFTQVTAFLRYIRWKITIGGGDAVVMVDIVAKE